MNGEALITDPVGLTMVFLVIPAVIYYLQKNTRASVIFKYLPVLLFLYFIPALLSTFDIIPSRTPVYKSLKAFIVPPTLVLLTMTVDFKSVLKLGPKALIMFFSGTLGVFLGAPLAYFLFHDHLPADIWKGLAALSGSWIGGAGNFIAVADAVGTSESVLGMMVIVDVLIGMIWFGILFFLIGKHKEIDAKSKADTSMIEEVKENVMKFQKEHSRFPKVPDYFYILAVGLFFGWVSVQLSHVMPVTSILRAGAWKVIFCTTFGLVLSFTPLRKLDGAGASVFGAFLVYILVEVIGAGANMAEIAKYPSLLLVGMVWISVHAICLLIAMKLCKAPMFFFAVGSTANIGGTASAPVVASAFHTALAPVGVLMALCGTVTGTYVSLALAWVLEWMSKSMAAGG
jgi:uncharacterized membrane protein